MSIKLAVFSDSHGETGKILTALSGFSPDIIVHLGDFSRDVHALEDSYPRIPVKVVRGNCDRASDDPLRDVFFCGDVKVFITHGHEYGVKSGLSGLYSAGRIADAGLVMFGHTHKAWYENAAGMHVLNPGPVCARGIPSWAKVEIIGSAINCKIIHFD